ncbi:MAG TPA: DoxX family protein [Xanthobacteraceae bacterium]|jgi:putative oxidoreductase|nr:DoxX family protein [Xanthobacteraceae bacterium]
MDFLRPYASQILSILRIFVGLLLLQYGLAKIFGVFGIPYFASVKVFSLIWFAGLIELIGGTLLVVGLFTRFAAFILSGQMAFAYFLGHFPKGFFPILNDGGYAILLCFTCLYLAAAGGGAWSLDRSLRKSD